MMPKDVVIVTQVRKLSGNVLAGASQLPRRWSRRSTPVVAMPARRADRDAGLFVPLPRHGEERAA
jgi:hypothetical protein